MNRYSQIQEEHFLQYKINEQMNKHIHQLQENKVINILKEIKNYLIKQFIYYFQLIDGKKDKQF